MNKKSILGPLIYPAAKKQRPPTIFSLSPTQPDEWELERSDIIMRNKLGNSIIVKYFINF